MVAPKVKICGVTNVQDAELAVELGAWAVGVILAPSPRRARIADAEQIAAMVKRRALLAGVFVNSPIDEIVRVHERLGGFDLVQLHGDEGTAFAEVVARRTGARIVKAMGVGDAGDVQALDAFNRVDYHLVDARVIGLRGGTGKTIDPDHLRRRSSKLPLVLSGGLAPENVADAIAAVDPYAVDVASGTEAAQGVKDPERMRAFFGAVQATGDEDVEDEHVAAPDAAEAG